MYPRSAPVSLHFAYIQTKGIAEAYGSVPTSAASSLHRANHLPAPILNDIRHISDGVTVGQEIPASRPMSRVVQPGTENEVGRNGEEEARHG